MSDEQENYGILFVVPLSETIQLNPNEIVHNFRQQWRIKIECIENPEWGDIKKGIRVYLLRNEFHNVILTYYNEPFKSEIVDLAISNYHTTGRFELTRKQKKILKQNEAFIVVNYKLGPPDAKKRVYFSAQVLLTLLGLDYTIGYFNRSSEIYRAKEHIMPFLQKNALDSSDLFILLTNIQLFEDKGRYCAYTHGLDQFGIPDIKVFTNEGNKTQYYWSLVGDAALYCINHGHVLKIGDTIELMGDGIIYRIKAAQEDPGHPFGRCGVIELVVEK